MIIENTKDQEALYDLLIVLSKTRIIYGFTASNRGFHIISEDEFKEYMDEL